MRKGRKTTGHEIRLKTSRDQGTARVGICFFGLVNLTSTEHDPRQFGVQVRCQSKGTQDLENQSVTTALGPLQRRDKAL
jgi:hypothetical protein